MKNWLKLIAITAIVMVTANAQQIKLYDLKSGMVTYKITGSGATMGVSTKTTGEKSIIFDSYGAYSMTKQNTVEKSSVNGKHETAKKQETLYMKNGVMYSVDHKHKKIMRMENTAAMMFGDMRVKSKEMMQQMGGQKTGTAKVLGYRCDVWEFMGTKQCIYKGIPLKIESDMMGLKHVETAIKAKFNIHVSKSTFELPNFPITDERGNPVNKKNLAKMDAQSNKNVMQAQEVMQRMQIDGVVPAMKHEVLSMEKDMRAARKCLQHANSASAAQKCMAKINRGEDEEEDDKINEWNARTKKELLHKIDQYLNMTVPCIKKAQTVHDIEMCSPDDK